MPDTPDFLRSPTVWSLFFASLFATAALTPLVMQLARRIGAVDGGGHRRIYVGSMPLLGGLGILLPFVGVCLLGMLRVTGMFGFIGPFGPQLLVLAAGSLAIAGVGLWDDLRGLRMRHKLLLQAAIALFVVINGTLLRSVDLPLLGEVQVGKAVAIAIGVLWIVGLTNAMNLIDGVDGLAAGIALIAAVGLTVLGAIVGQTFMVLMSVSLAGSLVGFLPYNFHPARLFLGDTGSMFLGFVLATITLMGTYKSEAAVIVVAPLLALGVPIFETTVSMVRRWLGGGSIFAPDDRHTHHRLLSQGYSQRGVVMLLCGVSAILTSVAIVSRLLPEESPWEWMLAAVVVATLAGIGWLAGYLRTVPVERVLERRSRNAVRLAFARYASLSLSSAWNRPRIEEVLRLGLTEFDLRYLAVELSEPELRIAVGARGNPESSPRRTSVKTLDGASVTLEYEFGGNPGEEERRDIEGCLAQLFGESTIGRGAAA